MSSDVGQNPPLPEFEPWNTLDLVMVDRLIEVASTARVRSRDHGYRTVDIVVIGRRIYFFADPESGLGVTSIASPVTLEIAVAQSAENGISTIVVHGSACRAAADFAANAYLSGGRESGRLVEVTPMWYSGGTSHQQPGGPNSETS